MINDYEKPYKLKFILTSKQKYNSKFQEFETVRNQNTKFEMVRTLKIQKTTKI